MGDPDMLRRAALRALWVAHVRQFRRLIADHEAANDRVIAAFNARCPGDGFRLVWPPALVLLVSRMNCAA